MKPVVGSQSIFPQPQLAYLSTIKGDLFRGPLVTEAESLYLSGKSWRSWLVRLMRFESRFLYCPWVTMYLCLWTGSLLTSLWLWGPAQLADLVNIWGSLIRTMYDLGYSGYTILIILKRIYLAQNYVFCVYIHIVTNTAGYWVIEAC